MIIKGSRYDALSETRNDTTLSIATAETYSTNNFFTIVSSYGDTFASLAATHLSSPHLYWKIADINKSIAFADFIPAGSIIKIPLQ